VKREDKKKNKKNINGRVIELCQRFVSNIPLWKAKCKIADAETTVKSEAFIMGLPKMRVLNVARFGQIHKVKCRLLFQLTRCTNTACCQSHPVEMFIKATIPCDSRGVWLFATSGV
jgi:hypothetical protein